MEDVSHLHEYSTLPGMITVIDTGNQSSLRPALDDCRAVTLNIDVSEIAANKQNAKQIFKGNKGNIPMVGHIAETDKVVAYDFCESNVPPNKDNPGFIKQKGIIQ